MNWIITLLACQHAVLFSKCAISAANFIKYEKAETFSQTFYILHDYPIQPVTTNQLFLTSETWDRHTFYLISFIQLSLARKIQPATHNHFLSHKYSLLRRVCGERYFLLQGFVYSRVVIAFIFIFHNNKCAVIHHNQRNMCAFLTLHT